MRQTVLAFCALMAAVSLAADSKPETAKAASDRVHMTPVAAPAFGDSNTTQFLAVDTKGHPLLLRGDSLEVFGLGSDASFDRRLGQLACDRSSGPAYSAAMDPAGPTWVVSWPNGVALCDFDKEQRPQGLRSLVSSVSYSTSGPLVAVTAIGPPPEASASRFATRVPRVLGLKDSQWQPVAWGPLPELHGRPDNPLAAIKAQTDSLICSGANDALWLAFWNRYRLQKLSDAEKPDREIIVGSGEVDWQKLAPEEEKQEAAGRKAQGFDHIAVPPSAAGIPRGMVRTLLCARDGYLYLVVSTPEGLALDRFSPSQNLLERVMLDGATTVSSGPMTGAVVGDQLWLGGRLSADGLWRISLEEIAATRWKPVPNIRFNG